jgi:hypothetical protein
MDTGRPRPGTCALSVRLARAARTGGHHRGVSRSRLFLALSWIGATAVATLISAAGVSIVTRDVTSNHGRALAAADVVALLDAGPAPESEPASPPSSTTPVDQVEDPDGGRDGSVPPPSPAPTAPSTIEPAPPVPLPPAATFAAGGGVIAVACIGDDVTLLSARPVDGFRVHVHDDGPEQVHVSFEGGSDHEIAAACPQGAPAVVDVGPPDPVVDLAAGERERARAAGRARDDEDEREDRRGGKSHRDEREDERQDDGERGSGREDRAAGTDRRGRDR